MPRRCRKLPAVLFACVLLCATVHAADIVWTNTAGGNWATVANWSPNQVPSTNDTAWITNNGTYTVTLNASATLTGLNLGGTSGTQTLSHANYTLTLNGPSGSTACGVYSLASGTIAGPGPLTLAGRFNWTGGMIGSTGSGLVVMANGGMTLSGTYKYLNCSLINGGAATCASQVTVYSSALFSNAPTATFDLTADGAAFVLSGSGSLFENAGILRKTAGTGTSTINVPCGNSGSVQVNSGTLVLTLADGSGSFTTVAGTTLGVNGTATLSAGSSITGAGNFTVTGGAITHNGIFNISGTNTFSNGTTVFEGTCTLINDALTVSGGTVNFSGTGTVAPMSLSISGGSLLGSMPVTVSGPFNWTFGTIGSAGSSLLVAANGGMALSGSTKYLNGGTLINGGAATWSAGTVYCSGTAVFSNTASATLDLAADGAAFADYGGTPSLANAGTLRKTTGTGTSTINVPCGNSGSVQVNTGSVALTLADGSGSFTTVDGTTLTVNGTATLSASSSITGPGNFTVTGGAITHNGTFNIAGTNTFSGGTMVFNGSCTLMNNALTVSGGGTVNFSGTGTVAPASLSLSAGSLLGSMPVTVSGPFNWTGGTIGGAGSSLVVTANGGITLAGNGKNFNGGTLVNGGTAGWSAGTVSCSSTALFSNAPAATLDLLADGLVFSGGTLSLANAGTLRKTAGTGSSTINVSCSNSGTVQVNTGTMSFGVYFTQNGGQTVLNGGNLVFAQTAQLRGGMLSGSGAVTGSVSNNATLSPGASPGLLSITGNYTEGANAHYHVELGGTTPGSGYDQLSVGGSAALAGTLDVSYWNGFTPGSGNVFTTLVCNARSGGFSVVHAPTNNLGTIYTSKAVLLEIGNASPSALLSAIPVQIACHTFIVQGSGADSDGTVTNITLLLGTNVLVSSSGASAQATMSYDGAGDLTFTALATDNGGAMGATNLTVSITTLPSLVLDPIGFQTNQAFKMCMEGVAGTTNRIEASDNLNSTNWSDLGVMENTNGIWRFSDKTATNSFHRYYRARQLP